MGAARAHALGAHVGLEGFFGVPAFASRGCYSCCLERGEEGRVFPGAVPPERALLKFLAVARER